MIYFHLELRWIEDTEDSGREPGRKWRNKWRFWRSFYIWAGSSHSRRWFYSWIPMGDTCTPLPRILAHGERSWYYYCWLQLVRLLPNPLSYYYSMMAIMASQLRICSDVSWRRLPPPSEVMRAVQSKRMFGIIILKHNRSKISLPGSQLQNMIEDPIFSPPSIHLNIYEKTWCT